MHIRPPSIPLLLVCIILLTACAGTPAASPAPVLPTLRESTATPQAQETAQTPQETPSILQALLNAEYPVEITSTGMALLKDGIFEEPAAPGSATRTRIRLGDVHALGDINGDGAEDALVTLVVDPGGSGTFTYLALVIDDNGTARPLAAVLLGDRIIVKSLALQSGAAVVTMLDRKPDEPMSAQPTLELTRHFKLQDGALVETQE